MHICAYPVHLKIRVYVPMCNSTLHYVHIVINPSIALKKQSVQFVYTNQKEIHRKYTTNTHICISLYFDIFFLETFSNIVTGNPTKHQEINFIHYMYIQIKKKYTYMHIRANHNI